MENWYQWAPVIAGAIVIALAWRVPRAAVWVALLLASFVLSTLWWNLGGDYPAMFGASTDLIIALIMLRYARNQWEFYALNCYAFMILVDIMWEFGGVPSHYWYAISLEAANWTILLLIGATGIAERGAHDRLHSRRNGVRSLDLAHRYLGRQADYPRWWRHTE